MPSQKRKRSSAVLPGQQEINGSMTVEENFMEPLYKVEILRGKITPKSKDKRAFKSIDCTSPKSESALVGETSPVNYTILPGSNWDAMRKYRNFVVGNNTFGVHDFVYVNNEDTEKENEHDDEDGEDDEREDDRQSWVALVLEIRAKSTDHVYLRVFWMYRPRDLPQGRLHYHGQNELIASNHMDIIDALTITDGANVMHMKEEDEEATVDGLYWRQKLNVVTGKLTQLRKACICDDFSNPDKLLLQCSNEECKLWLHEDCIIKHALEKATARTSILNGHNGDETVIGEKGSDVETNGTIEVAQPRGKVNGFQHSSIEESAQKSGARKRGRAPKSKMKSEEESLEGRFTGELEYRSKHKGEATSEEATGQIIITDHHGDEPTTSKVDMQCPKCEKPLRVT